MTNLEIAQFAFDMLPYILMAIAVFLSLTAKTRSDEIVYLLWVIIFMLIALGQTVSK